MKLGLARLKPLFVMAAVSAAFLSASAQAVTVTFTGDRNSGRGVIGHGFVDRSLTPWSSYYAALGVTGPYTELASPDAFDFTTGNELPIGTNAPGTPFGGIAGAPHGLEPVGITGPIHVGFAGFTLDYTGSDLSFSSATLEHRIYRGGTVTLFEESAPGVFSELGSLINAVLAFDINYATGVLSGLTTGTRSGSTPVYVPESYVSTAYDPIDNAGTTAEGPYGAFSMTATFEFAIASVAAPPAAALLAAGLMALGAFRRRRAG